MLDFIRKYIFRKKFVIAPKKYWVKCTWEEANMYVPFLEIDGKKNWELLDASVHYFPYTYIKKTNVWTKKSDGYYPELNFKLTCMPIRKL